MKRRKEGEPELSNQELEKEAHRLYEKALDVVICLPGFGRALSKTVGTGQLLDVENQTVEFESGNYRCVLKTGAESKELFIAKNDGFEFELVKITPTLVGYSRLPATLDRSQRGRMRKSQGKSKRSIKSHENTAEVVREVDEFISALSPS